MHVHQTIGADVVRACSVAGYIGVAYGGGCAEFYGHFNAYVLTYGEYALAVLHAVAGVFACRHGGFFAALVTVAPANAKGVTVTGTQTEESWYATVGQVCLLSVISDI